MNQSLYDYDLFVNYAKKDENKIQRYIKLIRKMNCSYWLDVECLVHGQNWKEVIRTSIERTKHMISFLSKNWAEQEWPKTELTMFRNECNKSTSYTNRVVLIVSLEDVPIEKHLTPYVEEVQRIMSPETYSDNELAWQINCGLQKIQRGHRESWDILGAELLRATQESKTKSSITKPIELENHSESSISDELVVMRFDRAFLYNLRKNLMKKLKTDELEELLKNFNLELDQITNFEAKVFRLVEESRTNLKNFKYLIELTER